MIGFNFSPHPTHSENSSPFEMNQNRSPSAEKRMMGRPYFSNSSLTGRQASSFPLDASQRRIILSRPSVASLPFGEQTRELIDPSWPDNGGLPVIRSRSKRYTFPDHAPTKISLPSALKVQTEAASAGNWMTACGEPSA